MAINRVNCNVPPNKGVGLRLNSNTLYSVQHVGLNILPNLPTDQEYLNFMFPLNNVEQIEVIIEPSFKYINIVMFRIVQIYISDTNKLLHWRSLKQCKTGQAHGYQL